uniref:Uncharacterized protein n=1 Tax=Siphoviridae sp. ctnks32 TaxID=2826457 RepID=A0A8S5N153_9CAUD|nr:MAG TPA: hypothetical protein [Siphoviridae sp. ctnks32]
MQKIIHFLCRFQKILHIFAVFIISRKAVEPLVINS